MGLRTGTNQSLRGTSLLALGLGQLIDSKSNRHLMESEKFLAGVMACPIQSVPVVEYSRWTTTLPLTSEAVNATFGPKWTPLQISTPQGILNVDTSFIERATLQCHMLCRGLGVHIWGEPMTFTVEGNSFLATATAPPVSPDVYSLNDLTSNALGTQTVLTSVAPSAMRPAILEWGFASWMAAWHCAHAYELNWWFNQRYTMLKEPLNNVCYFGPFAECDGAGTSQVSAQQFFKQVNDDYTTNLGSLKVIQPVMFQRYGSVGAAGSNNGLFRPTRNFDQVDATYGGMRNQGQVGSTQPYRKFVAPVFLEKGVPIGIYLEQIDTFHYNEFVRYMSAEEDGNTIPANVPFCSIAALQTYTTPGTAGVTAAEQTQDATPNLVTQQVDTTRDYYKGGSIEFEALIKGHEMNDRAWLKHINDAINAGTVVNATNPMGTGAIQLAA
jgi:hypothetical protein